LEPAKYSLYMDQAFALAEKGRGTTSPNPMVGAILVKNGEIIGAGFHVKSGADHAEVIAIKEAEQNNHDVAGSVLICTLEPCCHQKKLTPPCTDLIIAKKIFKVIFANHDPNPAVSGKGAKILAAAGIKVVAGVLKERGEILNKVFMHNMQNLTPYIHLKMAQTLDGKIATFTGDSRWISDKVARTWVHQQRFFYDGILIGRNTVNQDNPLLSIRMGVAANGKVPYRIILGNPEKLDWQMNLFNDKHVDRTILMTKNEQLSTETKAIIKEKKITLFVGDLNSCLKQAYDFGIKSIFVEGGSSVFSSFINASLYNELTVFISAKFLGDGENIYRGPRLDKMGQALNLKNGRFSQMGSQMVFSLQKNILESKNHDSNEDHKCLPG